MRSVIPTFNLFGLELPLRPTVAVIVGCLVIVLGTTYEFTANIVSPVNYAGRLRLLAVDHLFLYMIVPLAVIRLGFGQPASDYGFRIGDWRAGLKLTLIGWAVTAPVLLIASRLPTVQSYYSRFYSTPPGLSLTAAIDLFGWEFLVRGFLLWSLWEVAGPFAVVLQMIPFALAHIGKPGIEIVSTVFTGILFGWIGWRTRSFLYPFLIHLFINVFVILLVSGFLG